jgi:hypothetical protein
VEHTTHAHCQLWEVVDIEGCSKDEHTYAFSQRVLVRLLNAHVCIRFTPMRVSCFGCERMRGGEGVYVTSDTRDDVFMLGSPPPPLPPLLFLLGPTRLLPLLKNSIARTRSAEGRSRTPSSVISALMTCHVHGWEQRFSAT